MPKTILIDSIPSLECPIDHETMTDPYITEYGHSYNQTRIVDWQTNHGTCPFTRAPLNSLKENARLKNLISLLNIENKSWSDFFQIIEILTCPKSQSIMIDPVIIGTEIYEKKAVSKKFDCEDIALKGAIKEIKEQNELIRLLSKDDSNILFDSVLTKDFGEGYTFFHLMCEHASENLLSSFITRLQRLGLVEKIIQLPRPKNWRPKLLNELFVKALLVENSIGLADLYFKLGADVEQTDPSIHESLLKKVLDAKQKDVLQYVFYQKMNENCDYFEKSSIYFELLKEGLMMTGNELLSQAIKDNNDALIHSLLAQDEVLLLVFEKIYSLKNVEVAIDYCEKNPARLKLLTNVLSLTIEDIFTRAIKEKNDKIIQFLLNQKEALLSVFTAYFSSKSNDRSREILEFLSDYCKTFSDATPILLEIVSENGCEMLDFAVKSQNTKITAFLLSYHAKLEYKTLVYAFNQYSLPIVDAIIDYYRLQSRETKINKSSELLIENKKVVTNVSFNAELKGEKIDFIATTDNSVDENGILGSCGYISLGMKREAVYELMTAAVNEKNTDIIALISAQIEQDFLGSQTKDRTHLKLSKQFFDQLSQLMKLKENDLGQLNQQVTKLKIISGLKEASAQDLIQHFDTQNLADKEDLIKDTQLLKDYQLKLSETQGQLDKFFQQPELAQDYLNHNIKTEWLGTYIAIACAKKMGKSINIWGHKNQSSHSPELYLQLSYDAPSSKEDPIDILHTNNGTHFRRLQKTTVSQQLIKAEETSPQIAPIDPKAHYKEYFPILKELKESWEKLFRFTDLYSEMNRLSIAISKIDKLDNPVEKFAHSTYLAQLKLVQDCVKEEKNIIVDNLTHYLDPDYKGDKQQAWEEFTGRFMHSKQSEIDALIVKLREAGTKKAHLLKIQKDYQLLLDKLKALPPNPASLHLIKMKEEVLSSNSSNVLLLKMTTEDKMMGADPSVSSKHSILLASYFDDLGRELLNKKLMDVTNVINNELLLHISALSSSQDVIALQHDVEAYLFLLQEEIEQLEKLQHRLKQKYILLAPQEKNLYKSAPNDTLQTRLLSGPRLSVTLPLDKKANIALHKAVMANNATLVKALLIQGHFLDQFKLNRANVFYERLVLLASNSKTLESKDIDEQTLCLRQTKTHIEVYWYEDNKVKKKSMELAQFKKLLPECPRCTTKNVELLKKDNENLINKITTLFCPPSGQSAFQMAYHAKQTEILRVFCDSWEDYLREETKLYEKEALRDDPLKKNILRKLEKHIIHYAKHEFLKNYEELNSSSLGARIKNAVFTVEDKKKIDVLSEKINFYLELLFIAKQIDNPMLVLDIVKDDLQTLYQKEGVKSLKESLFIRGLFSIVREVYPRGHGYTFELRYEMPEDGCDLYILSKNEVGKISKEDYDTKYKDKFIFVIDADGSRNTEEFCRVVLLPEGTSIPKEIANNVILFEPQGTKVTAYWEENGKIIPKTLDLKDSEMLNRFPKPGEKALESKDKHFIQNITSMFGYIHKEKLYYNQQLVNVDNIHKFKSGLNIKSTRDVNKIFHLTSNQIDLFITTNGGYVSDKKFISPYCLYIYLNENEKRLEYAVLEKGIVKRIPLWVDNKTEQAIRKALKDSRVGMGKHSATGEYQGSLTLEQISKIYEETAKSNYYPLLQQTERFQIARNSNTEFSLKKELKLCENKRLEKHIVLLKESQNRKEKNENKEEIRDLKTQLKSLTELTVKNQDKIDQTNDGLNQKMGGIDLKVGSLEIELKDEQKGLNQKVGGIDLKVGSLEIKLKEENIELKKELKDQNETIQFLMQKFTELNLELKSMKKESNQSVEKEDLKQKEIIVKKISESQGQEVTKVSSYQPGFHKIPSLESITDNSIPSKDLKDGIPRENSL